MPNIWYRKGAAFEWRCMAKLRKAGYFVLRAPGSKGKCDLVAFKASPPILMIQCKFGRSHFGLEEWNGLYEFAQSFNGLPLLVMNSRTGGDYIQLLGPRSKRQKAEGLFRRFDPFGQESMF